MIHHIRRFLSCFWIPSQQTVIVMLCGLFIVLPIPIIGILIKSISVLLFLFFLLGICLGGLSIFKGRHEQLNHQRQMILNEREIEVDIQKPYSTYRLRAINSSSIIIFEQEYFTMKAAIQEIKKWKEDHPCLKCVIDPILKEQWF